VAGGIRAAIVAVGSAIGAIIGLSSQASAADAASVRLKWLPQAQFAGVYVAKAKNFYKDAGLDITINPGGPNINVETLVASRADTFGVGSGIEGCLYARERGLPLVCIGMSQQLTPLAFVAYKDSGIDSVQKFKGKKVAAWFTGPQYTLYAMLAHVGLSPSDLTIVPQPFSMQPFLDRQFDAAMVMYYNELNTLKEQGITDLYVIAPESVGVTTQQDSLVVSEKMIKEKPQQVQAFLDATLKGWRTAFQHKAEAIDIVMAAAPNLERRHQELMLDEIQRIMIAGYGSSKGLGAIDMPHIEAVYHDLLRFNALKSPVDLQATFDSSFWDNVPEADKKP
jgi:NitT/TauT family transport system substrate-binding protein